MNRCTPIEMKANLEAVEHLQKNGIDFVPIPVSKNLSKEKLIALMLQQLDELEKEAAESCNKTINGVTRYDVQNNKCTHNVSIDDECQNCNDNIHF